jgi:hypothetical protein
MLLNFVFDSLIPMPWMLLVAQFAVPPLLTYVYHPPITLQWSYSIHACVRTKGMWQMSQRTRFFCRCKWSCSSNPVKRFDNTVSLPFTALAATDDDDDEVDDVAVVLL